MHAKKKRCTTCGKLLLRKFFYKRWKDQEAVQGSCKKCARKWLSRPEALAYYASYARTRRRDKEQRAKFIMYEAAKLDKKHGRISDLDCNFIDKLIRQGCAYCGVSFSDSKITLDRIDNSKGHLKSNVVPACWNCNLIRGTMPYAAWLLVAKALKIARKKGLLDGWRRTDCMQK